MLKSLTSSCFLAFLTKLIVRIKSFQAIASKSQLNAEAAHSANQERVLSARLSAVSQTGMQNSQKVEAVFHEVLNCFLRSTYISLSRAKIVDGRLQTTKIGFLL